MRKEDCFYLGHISRKHGLKGEVIAVFDTDQPQRYQNLESVFVELHGELVPFFIQEMATNSKGHFILDFEDVGAGEADRLLDRELYLPLDFLPQLSGKAFYYHEVIGFRMIDRVAGDIGICSEIIESSAQPIFRIKEGETEILVPAVDEFIISIDREKEEIHLDCPEGLIDLYRRAE